MVFTCCDSHVSAVDTGLKFWRTAARFLHNRMLGRAESEWSPHCRLAAAGEPHTMLEFGVEFDESELPATVVAGSAEGKGVESPGLAELTNRVGLMEAKLEKKLDGMEQLLRQLVDSGTLMVT